MPYTTFSEKSVRLPSRVQVQTERERLCRMRRTFARLFRVLVGILLAFVLCLLVWLLIRIGASENEFLRTDFAALFTLRKYES